MSDPNPGADETAADENRPTSEEGEGSTKGLSNPDLHGQAREVAEKATGEDGPPPTPAG